MQPTFKNEVPSDTRFTRNYFRQINGKIPTGKITWNRGEYLLIRANYGDQDLIIKRPERALIVNEFSYNQNLFIIFARDHNIFIYNNELIEIEVELRRRVHLLPVN